MNKIAVILIRGLVNVSHDKKKTLELMRILKKHVCVVVENNEINKGMINKIKDYVTYGEITKETYEKMLQARAESIGGKKPQKLDSKKIADEIFENKIKNRELKEKYEIKPYFRLHPPKGGFEKKGIKKPYRIGGALGYRGDEINNLIVKML